MRAGLVFGVALGGVAMMASLSPALGQEATIKQALSVRGECTEALHGGKLPQYHSCSGIVFQFTLSDGSIVIMFSGAMSHYFFLGKGSSWNQKGAGRITLSAVAAGRGDAYEEFPAKGYCRFENLHAGGKAIVSCSATMSKGHWSAAFKSNGKPPEVEEVKG